MTTTNSDIPDLYAAKAVAIDALMSAIKAVADTYGEGLDAPAVRHMLSGAYIYAIGYDALDPEEGGSTPAEAYEILIEQPALIRGEVE